MTIGQSEQMMAREETDEAKKKLEQTGYTINYG